MRIHKEGKVFLIVLALLLIGFNLLTYYLFGCYLPWLFWLLLVGSVVLAGFFTQFFRNPVRVLTLDENAVVSPADGKVVVIEKVFEPEYLKTDCMQVSVFMSPFNVHLNKVPISGNLEYYKYHPGKYLVAFHPKSSLLNERNTSVIRTLKGQKILVRQIAGAVARRICYYLTQGQEIKQGEDLGFIKFGSRCDIFLPLDADIKVEMNQAVKGGQDIIAYLR
jgi:phosphatidylserine decarboxylase